MRAEETEKGGRTRFGGEFGFAEAALKSYSTFIDGSTSTKGQTRYYI